MLRLDSSINPSAGLSDVPTPHSNTVVTTSFIEGDKHFFTLRPELQLALSWAIEFSMRIATICHFTKSNRIYESKRVWHMPTCYRFFIHQHLRWVLKLPVTEIVITHSSYTKAASYTLPF
jgi:hypothetical protein